jgi:hypothetical protein|tara:strand:- start:70 stop:426 length:357 start_codon:yes stop_codon:yes gene_type:complete
MDVAVQIAIFTGFGSFLALIFGGQVILYRKIGNMETEQKHFRSTIATTVKATENHAQVLVKQSREMQDLRERVADNKVLTSMHDTMIHIDQHAAKELGRVADAAENVVLHMKAKKVGE